MDLLCIDTGFRYAPCALFENGSLKTAFCLKLTDNEVPKYNLFAEKLMELLPDFKQKRAIIEYPVFRKSTQNPESIIKLSCAVGAYTSILQTAGFDVRWVKPSTWKGTVPKHIFTKRILARLSSEEKALFNNKDHNIVDAVGIGLWSCRRLK